MPLAFLVCDLYVTELGFFRENPLPFVTLAKELYPGHFEPTIGHRFIRLLHERKVLRRCYSQNIDGLELVAGLPEDKLIQAHGGFSSAHCIDCDKEAATSQVKASIFKGEVPRCEYCKGLVKPDIVFFGEGLPDRFMTSYVVRPSCAVQYDPF